MIDVSKGIVDNIGPILLIIGKGGLIAVTIIFLYCWMMGIMKDFGWIEVKCLILPTYGLLLAFLVIGVLL